MSTEPVSDTPETDFLSERLRPQSWQTSYTLMRDVARTLERQRDEARAALADSERIRSQLIQDVNNRERGIRELTKELEAAQAELVELREDKERLDTLESEAITWKSLKRGIQSDDEMGELVVSWKTNDPLRVILDKILGARTKEAQP